MVASRPFRLGIVPVFWVSPAFSFVALFIALGYVWSFHNTIVLLGFPAVGPEDASRSPCFQPCTFLAFGLMLLDPLLRVAVKHREVLFSPAFHVLTRSCWLTGLLFSAY